MSLGTGQSAKIEIAVSTETDFGRAVGFAKETEMMGGLIEQARLMIKWKEMVFVIVRQWKVKPVEKFPW